MTARIDQPIERPGSRLFNRTRTSRSIPRRLLREGRPHLLPLYALLRTSDLAREGIEGSGSYRFADHVYRGRPSGRYGVGTLLDALLLRLRPARSMRRRLHHARAGILDAAMRHPAGEPFRVLSVPCGIARELVGAADVLLAVDPELRGRARFFGMDLDPRPLELSRMLAAGRPGFRFLRGDALDRQAYPVDLDLIVSTGLAEFMADDPLIRFYEICRGALREGGALVTSATRRDPRSDWIMRELAELRARYREPDEAIRLLRLAGFDRVSARRDDVGLQTLLVAHRGANSSTHRTGGTS